MNSVIDPRETYYARIVPILGEGLRRRRIAVCGVAAVAGAIERLAGCRALRWDIVDDTLLAPEHPLVRGWGAAPGTPAGHALAACLRAHNTWEDDWRFDIHPALGPLTAPALAAAWRADPPDLLLGGGDPATLRAIAALARRHDLPALLVLHWAGDDPTASCLALLPGDAGRGRDLPDLLAALGDPPLRDPARLPSAPAAWHAWAGANALAALLARAMLLHGTRHASPDLDAILWAARRTAAILGSAAWPWSAHYVNLSIAGPRPTTSPQPSALSRQFLALSPQPPAVSPDSPPILRGHRTPRPLSVVHRPSSVVHRPLPTPQSSVLSPQSSVLVVGCGSLGSHAARALVASGAVRRLVLVDGDTVDAANPVRQYFHTDQVGQSKAEALAANLAALDPQIDITAIPHALEDTRAGRAALRHLLRTHRPAVALLATGSEADYGLARVLRAAGIPHVVGRCYPRARYFEAIVVDGRRGPCFGCLRGHLYTGAAPPPTPEEILRYDRAPAPGALQAEPATVVESGRAADVLARVVAELARPRPARAPWLAALLAAGQTCLIGANSVAQVADPQAAGGLAWAYGIPCPGQVVAFGLAQVQGSAATATCADCGRRLSVTCVFEPTGAQLMLPSNTSKDVARPS